MRAASPMIPTCRKAMAVALLALLMLSTLPIAVRAQPPAVDGFLGSIGGWVDARTPLAATVVATSQAPRDLDVTVDATLYRAVTSRSALASVLASGVQGRAVVARTTGTPRQLPAGGRVRASLRATWEDLGRPRVGVYPVTLRLEVADAAVWSTLTAVAVVEEAPKGKLRFASVIPLGVEHPPVRTSGAYRSSDLAGFRLDALTGVAAAAASGAGTALAPAGATLDAIADLAAGDGARAGAAKAARAALRTAVTRYQPVQTPYARIDPAWLHDLGATADLARHLDESATATRRALGAEPSSVVALLDLTRLDRAVIDDLAPGATIVVPESSLGPRTDEPYSPDLFGTSTALAFEGGTRVLVADTRASEIATTLPAVEAAQGILMETAIRWLELPVFAPERLFVFAPARMPSPGLLRPLLAGAARAPWLRAVPLSSITETEGEVESLPAPAEPAPTFPELRTARQALAIARATFGVGDGTFPWPLLDWTRAFLIGQRLGATGEPGDPARLTALEAEIRAALDAIHPAIDRRVTLTSRSGVVPVVLVNENPFPATVEVRLFGRRVQFPDGGRRTIDLTPGDTTLEFPVDVLGRGQFPVTVEILTLNGRPLSQASVTLRSTQVSGVALILVVGGVLFLLLQGVRRRRARVPSHP